jgi:hypothetical protein
VWPATTETLTVQFVGFDEQSLTTVKHQSVVFELQFLPCPYNQITVLSLDQVTDG